MNNKIVLISGTDFNIDGIQRLGNINNSGIGEVVKFNKYGFMEIQFDNKPKHIKRHLSDCDDITGMLLGKTLRNLTLQDDRWVIIHNGKELINEEVWVIKLYNNDGYEVYLSRSDKYGYSTSDITKAWFTFDYNIAKGYANKQSIAYMKAFTPTCVSDDIKLDVYE